MGSLNGNGLASQRLAVLDKDPLRRAWRGNKEDTIQLKAVPSFNSPYEEREWIKAHMAAALRYWGKLGFGEGIAGHITVRDPVFPDHYWMNPFDEHFSTITKSMLVLVGPDGYVSTEGAQAPINAAGFYIHSSIHKARPEVKAAAHCHSIHGKAWSVFGRPIDMLVQDSCLFYNNQSVYKNFGGVVLSHEEGANIAKALGPKSKACILQNHGLLTLGDTVDEAVYLFGALDRLCHVQLMVEAAAANNIPKTLISEEDAEFTANSINESRRNYIKFQLEYKLLLQETQGAFLQ
ncbi:arad-like aldolase/epimerase [Lentinula edodes]|uniref:arad-like aldolase/epimerase n=1 Tax=Lentinula edodes TaxID=5353 RepID=UPI001E8D99F6|nr:arad-like aldolase/epimerase [Lentinula edodes]KAH7879727.1 arad-like aldolase/epimerase [Lentinula edodes]